MIRERYEQRQYTAMQAVYHKAMNDVLCEEIEAAKTKIILLEYQVKTLKRVIAENNLDDK